MTAELCECRRLPFECAADPRSRLGALALLTTHCASVSVPLSTVLDDGACLVGVCNALAALAAVLVVAQGPDWLPQFAVRNAQRLEAA